MSEKLGINLIILGKTGVGKSSFCNYIFDKDIFKKGIGKPVTTWKENFQMHSTEFDKYTLNIYDTVGIEPNNFNRWIEELNTFISKRNDYVNQHPSNWIHGAFYLINGTQARIESTEIKTIKTLFQNISNIHAVITNADKANDEQKKSLREKLMNEISHNLPITEICSVNSKTRKKKSEPYGKEEVLKVFLTSLRNNIKPQLTLYSLHCIYRGIDEFQKELIAKIEKSDLNFWNMVATTIRDGEIDDLLGFNIDDMELDKYNSRIDALDDFIQHNFPPNSSLSEDDITDNLYSLQEEIEDRIEELEEEFSKKLSSIESAFDEEGSFMDKLIAIGTVAKILWDVKAFFINTTNEIFDSIKEIIINHQTTYITRLTNINPNLLKDKSLLTPTFSHLSFK